MLDVNSITDTMRRLKRERARVEKGWCNKRTNKQVKKDKSMGVFKIQRRSEQVGCRDRYNAVS